ncbi:P-loop NTPase fold protein [Streptomyces sp. NPDC006879]|uniref:P-loop NTPase fold protein n=1 Tax=Streptomyces sp. NPDC006879 TaxID=3364767 RepID=UPI00367F71F3
MTTTAVREAAFEGDFIAQAFASTRTLYINYRRADRETMQVTEEYELGRAQLSLDWPLKIFATAISATLLWGFSDVVFFGGWLSNWATLFFIAVAFLSGLRISTDEPSKQRALRATWVLWLRLQLAQHRKGRDDLRSAWATALETDGILPQMRVAVSRLIGEDQDSLLVLEDHDGLKDTQNPRYVVATRAVRQLRQKMAQIDGGTIAVCGPRGAGKSTLLRSCTDPQSTRSLDLSVFVQAPAEYAPQEFLLTLFGEVCEKYLNQFSLDPAETGVFVSVRKRRVMRALRKTLKWLFALVLALTILAVGLGRGAQWLYENYATPEAVDQARLWWEQARDTVVGWWRDHPWISGIALTAIGLRLLPRFRRLKPGTPSLAQECQRYLYRLRTVQNSTTAVNLGLPAVQGVSLGTSRTTSVSSVPFTFPELVTDFRELLEKIASQVETIFDGRVVVAIDELDRLGDADTARKFLAQIKAIFGIKGVYYLVSVAEDVGAAFVRRGLPHRDVTDSSLDDLLYLQPRTVEESKDLLAVRAPSLTPTYCLLLHALSGGIPRDLIRYARRLVEVHHWTDQKELKDLAPKMILEELADTLEGFRTLLAMQEWTAEGAPLLNRLYILVRLLRSPREQAGIEARTRIQFLADNPLPELPTVNAAPDAASNAVPFGTETLALWQEASACAYFSLTLLQIFGAPDFDNRYEAARNDRSNAMSGDPQRLAEARQELAVSPFSARILLDDIRAAWDLAPSNPWLDPR